MPEAPRIVCSLLNTFGFDRPRKVLVTGYQRMTWSQHRTRRPRFRSGALQSLGPTAIPRGRNLSITNPETVSDVPGYLVLSAVWLLGMYAVVQSGWL
jgi:hypothetical protein